MHSEGTHWSAYSQQQLTDHHPFVAWFALALVAGYLAALGWNIWDHEDHDNSTFIVLLRLCFFWDRKTSTLPSEFILLSFCRSVAAVVLMW